MRSTTDRTDPRLGRECFDCGARPAVVVSHWIGKRMWSLCVPCERAEQDVTRGSR